MIDPIDQLSEAIFSILIFMTYVLAFWIFRISGDSSQPVSQQELKELLLGVLGAIVAWGIIDGIMYAFLSAFERGERNRLLLDIQTASTEQEAVDRLAEDMDYFLEPISGDDERTAFYRSVLSHIRKGKPQAIGIKGEDISSVLGHVLVAVLAVIPSLLPLVVLRQDINLAIRISFLVSFIVLFAAGFRWGIYTRANPWKTGVLLVSVAIALVIIAGLLGG
ncbi:MAG: hypothetical protein MUE67_09685 [Anaerolineales bacterium]|nr:hypothetical protein [Anaerolineales bacterium]